MSRPVCSDPGCHAHAWHDGYCNYHALQHQRRVKTKVPSQASKRSAHRRAEELGITLAEGVAQSAGDGSSEAAVDAQPPRARTGRKARSPVG